MAIQQIQHDGDAARLRVRQVWPGATSTYTGAYSAQVYDEASGTVLGEAEAAEFAVEHAWVNAAERL